VRAQFNDPINVIKRARFFATPARESWSEMQMNPESASPLKILTAVFNAANALASLSGAPIPERKLLADFPVRAKSIEQADMIQTIFSCVSSNVSVETAYQWLPAWEIGFKAASRSPSDLRLHPARLAYYKTAIESQLASDLPRAALWPLLHTWALAAESDSFDDEQTQTWNSVCTEMGLSATNHHERLQSLDIFLDRLEEILEQLADENGVS
jgi:hypothetical protein